MKVHAPKSHPRYLSNYYRDLMVEGVKLGITSMQGLTAHGRGETFDYLIGEKTWGFAKTAIHAAAASLILAKHPVLSVNGNTAMLAAKEFIKLSKILPADIEINLFHESKNREIAIKKYLQKFGTENVLLPGKTVIPGIKSNRRMINAEGQAKADVIVVPLEDGDRTEALRAMGKTVITIDLNPLSRSGQRANITIIDNITRAFPLLIKAIQILQKKDRKKLQTLIKNYDNRKVLREALKVISTRLLLQGS